MTFTFRMTVLLSHTPIQIQETDTQSFTQCSKDTGDKAALENQIGSVVDNNEGNVKAGSIGLGWYFTCSGRNVENTSQSTPLTPT